MTIPKLKGYDIPSSRDSIPSNKVKWQIDPNRAVLLIHDMQEYFLNFWGLDSKFATELVKNINRLRFACKAVGIPVYYTAQPIDQKPEDRGLLNDMWGPGIDNLKELQGICKELTPDENDTKLVKWRYSAFKRSSFSEQLKEKNRDQLIICGVYGHIGVLATGMDAFMQDIQPFLVADAIGDFTVEDHNTTLKWFAQGVGSVFLTNEIINGLVNIDLNIFVNKLLEEEGEEEKPEEDDNLVDYGVDSVKIMSLASRWQYVFPKVDFVALSQEPTIANWKKLYTA